MRLNPAAFNAHLNQLGQRFSWRRSYACPCLDQGQPQYDCPHCSGKGRLWGDGLEGIAGIVARSEAKKFAPFGVWDDGDILLSIPSDSALYAIGQYDRVTALDKREPFSVNIVSGLNDLLKYRVTDIYSVFWIDGVDLVQGLAPTVNADGTLTWANPPPAGKTYALTGRRMPEYYCFQDMPIDRPEHSGAQLPRRVALRRFDLFGL